MSRASFRQADIERILRAARKTGSIVQIDLRTLVITVLPGVDQPNRNVPTLAPDGPETWD